LRQRYLSSATLFERIWRSQFIRLILSIFMQLR